MKTTPKHIAEYLLLRILVFIFRALPYRAALFVAWIIAGLLHYGFRFRVPEAHRRIQEVFGDKLFHKRVKEIAWISWRNICFNTVEVVRLPSVNKRWIEKHVTVPSRADVEKVIKDRKGAICATMHMGNWDAMGVYCHMIGYPLVFIARRQKNRLTDDYLNRMRGVTGVETLLNDESIVRNVIRQLRGGKWLAILPDVRSPKPAMSVPFLGKDANLAEGMAMFARQVDIPLVPLIIRRIGWTHHETTMYEPVFPNPDLDKKEDVRRIMHEMLALYTRLIRETPEQYFWYNKRWVLEPLNEDKITGEPSS